MISLHLFALELQFYIIVWSVHMPSVSLMLSLDLIYILKNITELIQELIIISNIAICLYRCLFYFVLEIIRYFFLSTFSFKIF